MDSRAKIPALALLGLQFTSACEPSDPIVGVWTATLIGGQMFPYALMEGEYSASGEAELRIGEDLRGQFTRRNEEDRYGLESYSEAEYDLEVVPGEAAKYRLEIVQPATNYYYGPGSEPDDGPRLLVLDCALTGDELRCADVERPDYEYRWTRKG
jgi:hypothetical protein